MGIYSVSSSTASAFGKTPHSDLGANWQRIYGAETQKNLGSNLLITASSSSDIIVEYEVCVRRANSERAKISWPPSTFML